MYLCERILLPKELCTIKRPKSVEKEELLSKDNVHGELDWKKVRKKDFGGRGHSVIDWVAIIFIVFFGILSVGTAWKFEFITIVLSETLHPIRLLLIGNVVGFILVIVGWMWWRNKKYDWPIPKIVTQQEDGSTV